MPRPARTKEELIVEQYINGEQDFRKLGRKYKITSMEVIEILKLNGIL